ncbi:class I SAM-dependent methyltransferase [Bacillus sp. JCM 19034]|uniref:class I SAM-dependent DNA methyltransferase n=1 Tax=Bacillus sp. JCM 19034 TaxID=1481928 RepID=UPI0007817518|nr:class I SAM-dependent methyltransferase [Bacillus sp. JCM 19034]
MSYQSFASFYDHLMAGAPYDQWLTYTKQKLESRGKLIRNSAILDIGCGTGEMLVRFHAQGANQLTGIDLSMEMLSIAREKCEQASFSPLLLQQSMAEFEAGQQFDLITIFCDSLNYLEMEEEVQSTFHLLSQHLKEDGLLLFDCHSISKIEQFIGETYTDVDESVSYIWYSFAGEYDYSVEHELTFFRRGEDGRYDRFEELHKQRTYPIKTYEKWLDDAGLKIDAVEEDFTAYQATDKSERLFFVCLKKE